MPKRITIKEIAKLANVSIGTVDRALHDRSRVAQATKDKILEIAKKGNYSSNIYARSLKLNRTYQIAVVLPDNNPYWDKHRAGISRGMSEFGDMGFAQQEYRISTTREADRIAAIEQALADEPDGLILTPNMLKIGGRAMELLSQTEVPFVFVDADMEGVDNLSFVGQDTFQSGRMAGSILQNPYTHDYSVWVVTLSESDAQNKAIKTRIAGLESFYKNDPTVKIIHINLEKDGLSIDELKRQMREAKLAVHLFIPNSKSHLLMNELHDIREQAKMRVIGYDLVDENVDCLQKGWVDVVIDQQPIMQGYLAVQSLYKYLILKSEVTKNQYLPLDIITKENLKYCDY
ncbi:LacI family DNA-binding transcriptional regulator [Reichenbachiella carrageenanivorans]|uniref:LacI family DNA-binding transcriptional regulator n=1 Tax=Reichenbachiella carrageenanivorans TaxID=2979869 RepID=A0ABY6CYR5_9BACT|nr:LacI family DNA-binding transcriptional regulator [Reichenbachiella carrageenanivorans]UXX79060.1 LacI family DNA-binding transcriptional regulator [Reichenbachiella carrageenanivorans]